MSPGGGAVKSLGFLGARTALGRTQRFFFRSSGFFEALLGVGAIQEIAGLPPFLQRRDPRQAAPIIFPAPGGRSKLWSHSIADRRAADTRISAEFRKLFLPSAKETDKTPQGSGISFADGRARLPKNVAKFTMGGSPQERHENGTVR